MQDLTGASFLRCELHSGEILDICFDMGDWPEIASIAALDACDIYVKRSLSYQHLSTLPEQYKAKIVPYGFYFACSQESLGMEFKAARAYWLDRLASGASNGYMASIFLARWIARALFKRKPLFIPLSSLEAINGGENTVFYHARIWNPVHHRTHASKTIEALNNTRMNLVRTLKEGLGEKFIGGITPSEYASRICPELITPHGSDSASYMKLLSQSKIVITEEGLHGSTGSRLGEYFAANRCVVSEALYYEVPNQPINGKHWHVYNSVSECLEICQRLIEDPILIEETIQNISSFYNEYSSPQRTIFHLLEDKVSKEQSK